MFELSVDGGDAVLLDQPPRRLELFGIGEEGGITVDGPGEVRRLVSVEPSSSGPSFFPISLNAPHSSNLRVFDSPRVSGDDSSLWNDKALVRECLGDGMREPSGKNGPPSVRLEHEGCEERRTPVTKGERARATRAGGRCRRARRGREQERRSAQVKLRRCNGKFTPSLG